MIERIIIIDTVDPQTFYGPNNANMSLIRNLYPKLRVSARGNVIKVLGEEGETQQFEKKIRELEAWATKYNKLTEENIIDMVRGEAVRRPDADGVIIYGQTGRPISPRNANQSRMVRSFQENDLTFALGPAGTGKTYIAIALAVRALKNANCHRIDGAFPVIIHPDVAYDLMNDPKWLSPHQYVDTEHMYEGEIGKIEGCRFVESTEARIFHADDLASDSRTLSVNGAVSGKTTVSFDGGAVADNALVGRYVLIGPARACVTANTATTLTLDTAVTAADNAVIYPGEAGAEGRDVYATLVLAADGYGTTEITGGGLEHIVKQLGSAGTSDPLNQRASVGWKATKVAVRLNDSAIRRIETCSTYSE